MNLFELINRGGPAPMSPTQTVTNRDLLEAMNAMQHTITRLETRLCRYITHQGAGHILHTNPLKHRTEEH